LQRNKRGRDVTAAQKIVHEVSRITEVPVLTIYGKSRKRNTVISRYLCFWHLRDKLGWSTTEIGHFMRRDHSTVIHGLRSITNDMKTCNIPPHRTLEVDRCVRKALTDHVFVAPPVGGIRKRMFAARSAVDTYRSIVNWT